MSKRILIANAGNARIITEAIWGLKRRKDWIPEEIHIFTTNKRNGEFREAFEPSNPDDNKLTEVCRVLNIPQPHLNLHLVARVSDDGQKQPIELLKESWETEALNRCYEEELVPLLVDDQTEVVYLARCGLSEMQIIMSYYAAALMSPGKDYWYSVHIRVDSSAETNKQEEKLQKDPDFWYPRDITVGNDRLSVDQIQIDLKSWDYAAMKSTVSQRQFRNQGKVQEIVIDAEHKTLTIRANTVVQANMGPYASVFVLQTLANMYELRAKPYSNFKTKEELSSAFFEHDQYVKRDADGRHLLPYDDNLFEPNLRTLIEKKLAPEVMTYWHKGQNSIQEGASIPYLLDFHEVEKAIAQYFYTDPADFVRNGTYWWRSVPAFQWKWEKRLITPLPNGQVKKSVKLKSRVTSYAQLEDFISRNFESQNETAQYIAGHIFNITTTSTYSIEADRSSINGHFRKNVPESDLIEQLHWHSNGRLSVEADKIKFADASYLKQGLRNLSTDPNTRFDKNKIRNVLANPHKYTYMP